MNNSILVFDDVLANFSPELIELINKPLESLDWYSLDHKHKYKDFCIEILTIASKYFDFSKIIGYEFWGQNNTKPGTWHYDKDEKLYSKKKELVFPVCSTIYYLEVSDLVGGRLFVEHDVITPRTNRLVLFPPGKYHAVEDFTGKRVSLLVNPWDHKITK
jgi:hypothetical protein